MCVCVTHLINTLIFCSSSQVVGTFRKLSVWLSRTDAKNGCYTYIGGGKEQKSDRQLCVCRCGGRLGQKMCL